MIRKYDGNTREAQMEYDGNTKEIQRKRKSVCKENTKEILSKSKGRPRGQVSGTAGPARFFQFEERFFI